MSANLEAGPGLRLTPAERNVLAMPNGARQIEADIQRYAGLHSRHVKHADNRTAVLMLKDDLGLIGNGRFGISTPSFELNGRVLYNVEAKFGGNGPGGIVIVSAHLDSTAGGETPYREPTDPAPGADDDASGIAGVLAAARTILKLAALPDIPRREIRFVFFNAEEDRQRGSRAYASEAAGTGSLLGSEREDIRGVYQLDMIGHDADAHPAFQLHASYMENGAVQAASLKLANAVVRICGELSLDLVPQVYVFHPDPVRPDPGQDFSDHTSFHKVGYPACLVTEDFHPGPSQEDRPHDPNPFHHKFRDTIANLNIEYAAEITRAATAAVWHLATR